jgi:hypothetical protein
LAGRAILTSRLAGEELVLGPEAGYFDARDFRASLRQKLCELAGLSRAELNRRGAAIQQRVLEHFSWQTQAARMADFIQLCPR